MLDAALAHGILVGRDFRSETLYLLGGKERHCSLSATRLSDPNIEISRET